MVAYSFTNILFELPIARKLREQYFSNLRKVWELGKNLEKGDEKLSRQLWYNIADNIATLICLHTGTGTKNFLEHSPRSPRGCAKLLQDYTRRSKLPRMFTNKM